MTGDFFIPMISLSDGNLDFSPGSFIIRIFFSWFVEKTGLQTMERGKFKEGGGKRKKWSRANWKYDGISAAKPAIRQVGDDHPLLCVYRANWDSNGRWDGRGGRGKRWVVGPGWPFRCIDIHRLLHTPQRSRYERLITFYGLVDVLLWVGSGGEGGWV